jgi:hypothetical protein
MNYKVLGADRAWVHVLAGGVVRRVAWEACRQAADQAYAPALEGVYRDILRRAREIMPPERRQYHDGCRHEDGFCAPMVVLLDPDAVDVEGEEASRALSLHREITRASREEAR